MNQGQYTQTEEFARMMNVLMEEIGVDRREAEACLRDGDLFPLINVGSMIPFEGEEAVEQWAGAADTRHKLAESSYEGDLFDNPALAQSFLEAAIRADEMHKRAKERVGGE
jgi:hypothetical protein